jgi:hypothetical protein
MTRGPGRPRPLQPTRRVACRAVRVQVLRQRACRLRRLLVSPLDDVGTAGEAGYPPGHGNEVLADGRAAQREADTENQRGAEQSHGMPSVNRPLRCGIQVATHLRDAASKRQPRNRPGAGTIRCRCSPCRVEVRACGEVGCPRRQRDQASSAATPACVESSQRNSEESFTLRVGSPRPQLIEMRSRRRHGRNIQERGRRSDRRRRVAGLVISKAIRDRTGSDDRDVGVGAHQDSSGTSTTRHRGLGQQLQDNTPRRRPPPELRL